MRQKTVLACLLAATTAINASAQQDPPQWSSAASYLGGGLVRASNGNFYRCLRNNSAHDPTKDPHQYWELYYVRASITLTVASHSATFPSFKQAWGMLQGATIAAGTTATISINSGGGTYNEKFPSAFDLSHPFGSRIFIQGDNVDQVIFNFNNSSNGFTLSGASNLGGITRVTLDGSGSTDSNKAFFINGGSTLGPSTVKITNFFGGAEIDDRSFASLAHCTFSNLLSIGYLVQGHSFLKADATSIGFTGIAASTGMAAEEGSTIEATGAQVNGATAYGFSSQGTSSIHAMSSVANNCGTGYNANDWSSIDATNSTATNNPNFGYAAYHGAHILATGVTTDANGFDFNIATNTSMSDQSYIAN